MGRYLIKNATIINEGERFTGHILTNGEYIEKVYKTSEDVEKLTGNFEVIDAKGLLLLPGAIDDQVHFREPGLTHKGDIATESKAAIAGGITSFMEMPNTNPQTVTQEELEKKYERAAATSYANYSFYIGATNDNIEEILKTDPSKVCGVKIFMGSSTGNMLVDDKTALENIFSQCKMLIALHCEKEEVIRKNTALFKDLYGENLPMKLHPLIRSEEACYKSSSEAVELAEKHGTRIHVLHISTEKETNLFRNDIPLTEKKITAEACIHHLWFSEEDYIVKGSAIKWNPAIKTANDRAGIFQALLDNKIDVIATDHAPHTLEEKSQTYFNAPSGGPLVQHALPAMLEFVENGKITYERVVEKMSHAVAQLYRIEKRGYIREGYFADFVLVNPNKAWAVTKENILYKCGWSPFEGQIFSHSVETTFINGKKVYDKGNFIPVGAAQRLTFRV
jgi:dihydroorotase